MLSTLKKYVAHLRFLRRAYRELQQAAYEATTPERYGAGLQDIRRFVAWRFRRVQKGADLNNEILGLSCDVHRMYISPTHAGAARLRGSQRMTIEQEGH